MERNDTTTEDFEGLAANAESALSSGNWATAAEAYEALVRSRPEQLELKFKLAHAYEELGRMQDVIELLSDPSVAGLEQAKRKLASSHMKAKNYAAAMPIIDELLALSPNDPKLSGWKIRCERKTSRGLMERMQRGEALVSADRLEEAEQVYLALLSKYPDVGRAYLHLGQIYLRQNRWADAIPPLRAGLAIQPGNIKIRRSLARAHFKNGEPAEAVALLDSLGGGENDREALYLLQRCHVELHDWVRVDEVGARLLDMMLPDDPLRDLVSEIRQDALVKIELARIDAIAESGDLDRAILGYRDVADRYPESALAWLKLGTALADAGQDGEAAMALREALRFCPEDIEIRKALTRVVIKTSEEKEVLRYVQDAIAAEMADFECYRWLARYHADQHNWPSSLENAQNALAIDADHASARMLAVRALMHLGRLPEALEELDVLISVGAKLVEALQLKADIFVRLARLDEAINLYREALDAAPKDPLISYRLSHALLLKGDIEGFHRFHEKRRELSTFIEDNKDYPFEDWNGELSIEGRLLVWSESGFSVGESILHMAFLRPLAALGLDVVFEVQPRLVDICRRSFPDITIVANDAELPEGISHHTPLGSLSRGFKPDLASFDSMQPYFVPDVQAVAAHRDRLRRAAGGGQLLIGISWTSNNPVASDVESVQLDQLLDAIALPGVTLVNLQDGDRSQAVAVAEAKTGKRLMDSGIDNRNLDALAAVVAAMDLVVSVDHLTAHIAGAIGTPTYVLLPAVPAAHWLARGDRAIWYPATTLVRRGPLDGGWETVLDGVENAVRDFVNAYDPHSWLGGTSVPGLRPISAGAGTMCPHEICEAVRAYVAQGESAYGSALALSAAPQLRTLDDLPIAVDPAEIDAAMRPFLVSEVDDRRWDQWHAKIWRHTVDRLVSGREANRDRGLIERDYAVWATMGYERYRIGRQDLQGTPWSWRGRRLSLDGAAAARLRTVLLSAVLDQLRPRRVLEVGSGHGINLLSLAGAFPEIEFTGLELTHEGVEQARNAQSDSAIAHIVHAYSPLDVIDPSAIERIRFVQGDASAMPFGAGSFDLVMTVLAVEQMESIRSAALSEISRVTSGHVLMLEPFRDLNERGLRRLYVESRGYFRGSIGELRDFGLQPLWGTADFPQETFLGTAFVLAAKQAT